MYIITDNDPARQLLPCPVLVQDKFIIFEKMYLHSLVVSHNFTLEFDVIVRKLVNF